MSLPSSTPALYRAELRDRVKTGVPFHRRAGRRLPSNVPFVVDNIWEFTRPDDMPSRRSCVCASPAPELALEAASQGEAKREAYVVCRLELVGNPRLMQVGVKDARYHGDIEAVQQAVLASVRAGDWAEAPLERKLALAPLFLPGVTRDELRAAMARDALLDQAVRAAADRVTFWNRLAAPHPSGEIFFELDEGQAFILHPLA
ncbi:MAG: hypothetical protein AB1584_21375 [Pseudomonadota bacterium]